MQHTSSVGAFARVLYIIGIGSLLFFGLQPAPLSAHEPDSVGTSQLLPRDHLSLLGAATVGYMTPVAGLSEELIHSHTTAFYDLRLRYQTRPEDGDAFDALFRYPVLQAGVLVGDLSHIDVYYASRHKPYHSTLGYTISPYFGIERYFFQRKRWALGYDIFNGVSYNTHPYNATTNADNEYIGSHFSIFFGLGLTARYRVASHWTLSASFDFKHFSAASMVRPNLGVNSFGPTLGVTYDLSPNNTFSASSSQAQAASHGKELTGSPFYFDLSAAVIPKALPDEYNYLISQHVPDPSRCPVYVAYNASFTAMYRYLLHHASGLGIDYSYIPFTDRLRELDALQRHDVIDGRQLSYSPHVAGVALRHDIFYRHAGLNLGLGVYLHRHQGWRAETQESRFYQLIGLRYHFPFTHDRLFVGYTIKAHRFSKVDGLHFSVGYRFGRASHKP